MYMQCGLASCYNKQMAWFQKIYIPTPKMVIGKSEGEGVSKANWNFLRESMKQNWKFQGEGGWEEMNRRTILGGGMDIFWNHTF